MKVFSGGIHIITISALRVVGTEALLLCKVHSNFWWLVDGKCLIYVWCVCSCFDCCWHFSHKKSQTRKFILMCVLCASRARVCVCVCVC